MNADGNFEIEILIAITDVLKDVRIRDGLKISILPKVAPKNGGNYDI